MHATRVLACVATLIGCALVMFSVLVALGRPAHATLLNDDVSVDLEEDGFHDAVITISVGTKVVWENTSDTLTHTLVFTDGVMSEVIRPNHKYDRMFNDAGTRTYTDVSLPGKLGTIHVITGTQPPDPGEHGDAELHIATTHEQPIAAGATIDYRVRYENNSDDVDAQNVMITVTLPTSAALVSSSPVPLSQVSNTLVYSIGTLPAHTERRIDLKVKLPSPLPEGSEVSVKAVIAASNIGANSGGSSEDHNTVSAPKLSLGVRPVEDSRFVAGGLVTYSLQYANHSDAVAADNVTVTLHLPPVASFITATRKDEANGMTLTQVNVGNTISFYLGTIKPDSEGRILAQLRLSDALTSGQKISITAQIASAGFIASGNGGGHGDGDDVISDTEHLVVAASDLYVRLSSSGDTEAGGTRSYRVAFGNGGLNPATNVSLTVRFANTLSNFDFGTTPPTSFITDSNTAVWAIGILPGQTAAQPYEIKAKIGSVGELTATATIAGKSANGDDVEKKDDDDHIFIQQLTRPTIYSPKRVIVGTQQTFVGTGLANAEVSLYLSATQTLPGRLLGTAIVGLDRVWVITPSQPISMTGWHWVTATQVLTTQVSAAAGARFVVSNTLNIDPSSVTRDGIAVGGLNPKLSWRGGIPYKLAMKITACSAPLTPTLQGLFFNAQGLMSGYKNYTGTLLSGTMVFTFPPPVGTPFELYVDYYCPTAAQAQAALLSPSFALAGVSHFHDCFDAPGCVDEAPEPPEHCEDCYIEKEERPIAVRPIDPDGLVYDAAAVRTGATITQAIITNAFVTVTRQISPGLFSPWNAFAFNQVNPQFSDSVYPDKVLVPGYYSFFVPPGAYRIRVAAPGFLPYESNTLLVQAAQVTLNVPLERTNTLTAVGATTQPIPTPTLKQRVFLPMLQR